MSMLLSKAQITEASKWGGICALLLIAQVILPMGLDVMAAAALALVAGYGGWRVALTD